MRGKQERNISDVWYGACWIFIVRRGTCQWASWEKVMCRAPCRSGNAATARSRCEDGG